MDGNILDTEAQYKSGGANNPVCLAVAIITDEVPTELAGNSDLARRLYRRGERPEYRFYANDHRPRLLIRRDGQLKVVRWGNGHGQSGGLPETLWAWQESVRDGSWRESGAVGIEIPATFALDGRGVWYPVFVGIRGILVPDEHGMAVAYMLCEPASHYYAIQTGSRRMPVLIGQRI